MISGPLIYIAILIPVPHYLDYYSFVVGFEIGKCGSSQFVLFQGFFVVVVVAIVDPNYTLF